MSHAPALRALAAVAALLAAFVRARLAALEFAAVAAPPVRRLALPRRARLSNASLAETLPLGGVDSLAASASALFAGLSDGRVVRVVRNGDRGVVVDVVARCGAVDREQSPAEAARDCGTPGSQRRCGRPLGLFLAPRSAVFKAGGPTDDPDDDDDVLLIADAYKGLLAVARPHGRAPSLSRLGAATYLNDVVAAPCAEIKPSTRFQCEGIQRSFSCSSWRTR